MKLLLVCLFTFILCISSALWASEPSYLYYRNGDGLRMDVTYSQIIPGWRLTDMGIPIPESPERHQYQHLKEDWKKKDVQKQLEKFLNLYVVHKAVGFPWSPALGILNDLVKKGLLEDVKKTPYQLKRECIDQYGISREATAAMNIRNQPICVSLWKILENTTRAQMSGTERLIHMVTLLLHEHLHHFGYEDRDHLFYNQLKEIVAYVVHGEIGKLEMDPVLVKGIQAFLMGVEPKLENQRLNCEFYDILDPDNGPAFDAYRSLEIASDSLFDGDWVARVQGEELPFTHVRNLSARRFNGSARLNTSSYSFLVREDALQAGRWLIEVSRPYSKAESTFSVLPAQLEYLNRAFVAFGICIKH
jgi:hypothetical protein